MGSSEIKLMRGDLLLGTLTEDGCDMPFFLAEFSPGPGWEAVQPIFEAWTTSLDSHDPATDPEARAVSDALHAVHCLGATLVPTDGRPVIEDFIIHVRGTKATYRY
ncbi:hypothetical protein [Streptomyces sp. NPDC050738]|uniref:hypothetical protein n=1 Tax=Streptomyces sp. NPDC050738 TaxID=3154744 RepID=UPI003419765F